MRPRHDHGWRMRILNFDRQHGKSVMSVKIAQSLQSGNVVMIENEPVVVIKAVINKSGRNQAVVKVKGKNLLTNRVSELIFKSDDKLEGVMMEKKECKYSYFDQTNYVFVDSDFNQYEIDAETLSDLAKYLIDDMQDVCEVTFFQDQPISVVLPKIITREVEYTEPVVRGDTSGKISKTAILKGTKHELQVSAFVEIGDKIEIDTETGEFRRRCT
jgi:elongation factor P